MNSVRVRERKVKSPDSISFGLYERQWPNGSGTWVMPQVFTPYVPANYGRSLSKVERTSDELHPKPYTSGGPFDKKEISDGGLTPQGGGTFYSSDDYWRARIDGFICSQSPGNINSLTGGKFQNSSPSFANLDSLTSSAFGDVSVYGPTAWAKFAPGKPAASLGQFLGELHEVPRMLKTTTYNFYNMWKRLNKLAPLSAKNIPKELANEWLNFNFGWRPFVNDLRSFYRTWNNHDKLLKQIMRDNGQWVHRKGSVLASEDDVSTTVLTSHSHLPSLVGISNIAGNGSNTRITVSDTLKVWFAGRFRYYIPDCGSVTWKAKAVGHLFGAYPTPDLVYELTPWSWLIDWYTNVGDNFKNLTNGWADNLTAKYAYVMGTTTRKATVQSYYNLLTAPSTLSWDYEIISKKRDEASPFGFHLDFGDFSDYQWSILAALGLSRLR